jgi:hypothetical protein
MGKTSISKNPIAVSVIIANRNTGVFLSRLLNSLVKEKGNFEIIVVDDNSSDNSRGIVRKFAFEDKRVKLIESNKRVGAAKARNIGVSASCGLYLFFLDSDTKLTMGWFREGSSFFSRHPRTGIAIVKLLKMGTNRFDSAGELMSPFCFLVERARGAIDTGQFDREDRIFSGKSAAMIVRRDLFEKIEGFDEDYIIFLEDTDLCWRAQLVGAEVRFAPKIIVWHSFWTSEKSPAYYLKNRVYYYGAKNTITTIIKNIGFSRLLFVLLIQYPVWIILAILSLMSGRGYEGKEIIRGIFQTIVDFDTLIKKRNAVQKRRLRNDPEIFSSLGIRPPLRYYLGKARAYSTGTEY